MGSFVKYSLALGLLLLGGCGPREEISVIEQDVEDMEDEVEVENEVVLPVEEYFERRTFKVFGQYVQDRFVGYHAADDIEFTDTVEEVPVFAIADGVVMREGWVSGYGGLLTIKHTIGGRSVYALYGHIDLSSSSLLIDQEVTKGQFLANLGDGESEETDGERKHLHFALYEADELRLKGYVQTEAELAEWINPSEFFVSFGLGD